MRRAGGLVECVLVSQHIEDERDRSVILGIKIRSACGPLGFFGARRRVFLGTAIIAGLVVDRTAGIGCRGTARATASDRLGIEKDDGFGAGWGAEESAQPSFFPVENSGMDPVGDEQSLAHGPVLDRLMKMCLRDLEYVD
jgi:hypothetical protein